MKLIHSDIRTDQPANSINRFPLAFPLASLWLSVGFSFEFPFKTVQIFWTFFSTSHDLGNPDEWSSEGWRPSSHSWSQRGEVIVKVKIEFREQELARSSCHSCSFCSTVRLYCRRQRTQESTSESASMLNTSISLVGESERIIGRLIEFINSNLVTRANYLEWSLMLILEFFRFPVFWSLQDSWW